MYQEDARWFEEVQKTIEANHISLSDEGARYLDLVQKQVDNIKPVGLNVSVQGHGTPEGQPDGTILLTNMKFRGVSVVPDDMAVVAGTMTITYDDPKGYQANWVHVPTLLEENSNG